MKGALVCAGMVPVCHCPYPTWLTVHNSLLIERMPRCCGRLGEHPCVHARTSLDTSSALRKSSQCSRGAWQEPFPFCSVMRKCSMSRGHVSVFLSIWTMSRAHIMHSHLYLPLADIVVSGQQRQRHRDSVCQLLYVFFILVSELNLQSSYRHPIIKFHWNHYQNYAWNTHTLCINLNNN